MVARSTRLRNKHRRIIARDQPPCHICGEPIDYQLPHTDPNSFQIDHVKPVDRGGPDVLENIAASHRRCNRLKGRRPADWTPSCTFITDRTW